MSESFQRCLSVKTTSRFAFPADPVGNNRKEPARPSTLIATGEANKRKDSITMQMVGNDESSWSFRAPHTLLTNSRTEAAKLAQRCRHWLNPGQSSATCKNNNFFVLCWLSLPIGRRLPLDASAIFGMWDAVAKVLNKELEEE